MDKLPLTSWRLRLAFPFCSRWELPSVVSNCELFWRSLRTFVVASLVIVWVGLTYYYPYDMLTFVVIMVGMIGAAILIVGGVIGIDMLWRMCKKKLPACTYYIVEDEDHYV